MICLTSHTMRAVVCRELGPPSALARRGRRRAGAAARRRAGRRRGRGGELRRRPLRPGPVPDQAAAARSRPGARSPAPSRPWARASSGVAGRRPGAGHVRPGRVRRAGRRSPPPRSSRVPAGLDAGPGRHVHPELLHGAVRPAGPGRPAAAARPCWCWAPVAGSGWPPSTWPGPSAVGPSAPRPPTAKRAAALAVGAEAVIDTTERATSRTGPGRSPGSCRTGSARGCPDDRRGPGGRPGRWRPGRAGAAGARRGWPLPRHRLRRRAPSRPCRPTRSCCATGRVVGVDWGAWAMGHGDEQQALLGHLLDLVGGRRAAPGGADDLPARAGRRGPRRPARAAGWSGKWLPYVRSRLPPSPSVTAVTAAIGPSCPRT